MNRFALVGAGRGFGILAAAAMLAASAPVLAAPEPARLEAPRWVAEETEYLRERTERRQAKRANQGKAARLRRRTRGAGSL